MSIETLKYLDVLCPMHVVVNATGHIVHAGATVEKLNPSSGVIGKRFLEVFALKRPRSISSAKQLRSVAGHKLHLQMRSPPHTELKGVLVNAPDNQNMIVNLSFGISILDAVGEFSLNSGDFAPTDLAIEMLYLVEAKSAAMEASRKLNLRLQGAKIAAEEQAFTDTLTGLKNRRALDHILDRMIERDGDFALMHIDLDYFKAVNDTYGHAAGDHVLQEVSKLMVSETRDTDTVARVGGDEFTILLPNATNEEALTSIGRRIIEKLERPIIFQENDCRISASIGTSFFATGCGLSAEELVENADIALYASKGAGRARQTFYSSALRDNVTELMPAQSSRLDARQAS